MKITKINLQGFRAFDEPFELDLEGGKNLLLFGENGSGKSSIYLALNASSKNGEMTSGRIEIVFRPIRVRPMCRSMSRVRILLGRSTTTSIFGMKATDILCQFQRIPPRPQSPKNIAQCWSTVHIEPAFSTTGDLEGISGGDLGDTAPLRRP